MSYSNPMHRNSPKRGEPKDNSKRLDNRERDMQRMKSRKDKNHPRTCGDVWFSNLAD